MEIPGVGRMAVIADPQGATLNVMHYGMGWVNVAAGPVRRACG